MRHMLRPPGEYTIALFVACLSPVRPGRLPRWVRVRQLAALQQAARRKESYEVPHPQTRAGQSEATGMNRTGGNNASRESAPTSAANSAAAMGVTGRTVQASVRIATRLGEEARAIVETYETPQRSRPHR